MLGITNNGTCNQTTGQCECKQNVTGRQCDGCEDTFWGFRLPPIGDCRGKCLWTEVVCIIYDNHNNLWYSLFTYVRFGTTCKATTQNGTKTDNITLQKLFKQL